jgi:hypothetical protein
MTNGRELVLLADYSRVLADLIIKQDMPRDRILAHISDALVSAYELGLKGGEIKGSQKTWDKVMESVG